MVDTLARVMLDLRRLLDDYDNDNAHVPSGHGPEVTTYRFLFNPMEYIYAAVRLTQLLLLV